jgi:hypothetical protein
VDADPFDTLTRSLSKTLSRRRSLLAGLAGLGVASLLGPAPAATRHKKKRKKSSCAGKPDGTPCGTGKTCSGEVCAVEPTCVKAEDGCVIGDECCSGTCYDPPSQTCGYSAPGQPCHTTDDCIVGKCVGFVCRCTGAGDGCSTFADCCSGNCDGGLCACSGVGFDCNGDADCCVGFCAQDGRCDCLGSGDQCVASARNCCSGQCSGGLCT